MDRSDVYRRILINVFVLVGAVALGSMAMELSLRAMFAKSMDFAIEMWKYAAELKRPVNDPRLSFAHVPNRSAFLMGVDVSINSHGLRDREYALSKPSDVYRIIMLGDSTTLGWGVPFEQTIPKILERELNRVGVPGYRRCEVLNAGVGNYGTVQEVAHYETYDRAFHPDLVVLDYFINDAEPVPVERTPGLLGRSYLLAFTISRYDAVLRFAAKRPSWQQYYADLYVDGRPGLRAAQEALCNLAAMTAKDGSRLVVALLPELHRLDDGYPFAREQQKIKDHLAAQKVPVIDLINGLRGHGPENTLWVTATDPHPNGKANSLVAAQILQWVISNLFAARNGSGLS